MPTPVPSVVLKFEVVGFSEVFQQTPLAVTDDPPSEVTFPEQYAFMVVRSVTYPVVTEGVVCFVVNVLCSP